MFSDVFKMQYSLTFHELRTRYNCYYVDYSNNYYHNRLLFNMFVLGDITQEESLFLVSILHVWKGPTITQTQTLKLMRIQTIKNLVQQERILQLLIKIPHCDDEVILTNLQIDCSYLLFFSNRHKLVIDRKKLILI